jgi:hypothetical protein
MKLNENKTEEKVFTINNVEYKESELSLETKNDVIILNDLKQKKLVRSIELEQTDMLIASYGKRIDEALANIKKDN